MGSEIPEMRKRAQSALELEVEGRRADQARAAGLEKQVNIRSSSRRCSSSSSRNSSSSSTGPLYAFSSWLSDLGRSIFSSSEYKNCIPWQVPGTRFLRPQQATIFMSYFEKYVPSVFGICILTQTGYRHVPVAAILFDMPAAAICCWTISGVFGDYRQGATGIGSFTILMLLHNIYTFQRYLLLVYGIERYSILSILVECCSNIKSSLPFLNGIEWCWMFVK